MLHSTLCLLLALAAAASAQNQNTENGDSKLHLPSYLATAAQ